MIEIYNNSKIRFKTVAGEQWVSLTDMARASGKKVSHWNELKSTKQLLTELEAIAGITAIESNVGGAGIPENERGTWATKLVAIEFAGWCSISFKIWTLKKLDELLSTGSATLQESDPVTKLDLIKAMLPETPKAWLCKYQPSFWEALRSTYGLERRQRACGNFISTYIYRWFPEDVQDRIKEINPLSENGYTRENLIHQHFDLTLEDLLKKHIDIVTTNLIKAETKKEFKKLMREVDKYEMSIITKR